MARIADTLAATTNSGRATLLRDLAFRGNHVSRDAHQALAGLLTGRDLALLEVDHGVAAMDLGEAMVERAQVQIGLPNGQVVSLALAPGGDSSHDAPTGWSWTSDSDVLPASAGPDDQLTARLDIAAALITIATTLCSSAPGPALVDPPS